MWKRKQSLPYSEQPVNTGNTSIFMEDGRDYTLFLFHMNTQRIILPHIATLADAGKEAGAKEKEEKVAVIKKNVLSLQFDGNSFDDNRRTDS